MIDMATKMVAFRCAPQLLAKVNTLAKVQGKTRTRVITEAVRLFAREVKARGGRIIPPYQGPELLSEIDFEASSQEASTKRKNTKKRVKK